MFGNIDEYYIPYIAIGPGGKIRNSQYREILPENNAGLPVVPQILCANPHELRQLANEIKNFGYKKINLNLGCPYPMATKRGRGTGLLESPDMLKQVLEMLFSDFDFEVSVKFRSGLIDEKTITERVELLQHYPFEKLIFHPRTAKQLYKGTTNRELFARLSKMLQLPMVYNGDIQSAEDLKELKSLVPGQNEWMIGRGVLSDPLFIGKLNGEQLNEQEQLDMKRQFHQLILESYLSIYSDEGHVLSKMKQFWSYFANGFPNPSKTFKPVKKSAKLSRFMEVYPTIFQSR